MKRCPECRRDYYDDTLFYCLDDGNALLDGPATADQLIGLLPTIEMKSGSSTSPLNLSEEQTAILPSGIGSGSQVRRGLDKRLLAAPVLLAVIVLAGFFGYRYFKPDGSGPINSIAVLPFQNNSADADTDYLSDGLAESLIFRLSQLPGLKVSPTSSVIRYKGKETEIARIADELGVDSVMTGRLVKRGDSLNITVELVDTRNNKSLWGEQYERKMSDLLTTQREITAAITQKLQLKLAGNDAKGITKRYTDNNEAYELYLKGRFYFARRTSDDILRSIELFQQAIKLDANFALAYVGVAEAYAVMPSYPYMSPKEAMPQAKIAIAKALELDPELPEAHTLSAVIAATFDWDWEKAERDFKRSLELDPNLAITHYRYAWVYLSPMGRHDEAIAEMKRAMELEPLSLIQGANFAAVYMYARQHDLAVEQARKTYDLDPNFITGQSWLCHSYNAKGMYAESLLISEKTKESSFPLGVQLAVAYAKTGRREETEKLINWLKDLEKYTYVVNYWLAVSYAALGETDAAFAELEKSYQERDWFLPRLKVDPFMDPLRDDPRFKAMLKRMNLPE
jgi:TolB-like protein